MAKKIIISLLVAIIFLYPMQVQNMQNADAAIASKVATLSAKKVAKEVIQDAAVETAANFALMQAINIVEDYQTKPGFKVVCPDGKATCAKPIQVKENITAADKTAIKGQAGLELDKMINNGKAIPKWQKFLDWFLPVWLVTFGATVLTYALDSDVRSFFNETGYNALVALGFISPIETNKDIPLNEIPLPVIPEKDKDSGFSTGSDYKFVTSVGTNHSTSISSFPWTNTVVNAQNTANGLMTSYRLHVGTSGYPSDESFKLSFPTNQVTGLGFTGTANILYLQMNNYEINLAVDGKTLETRSFSGGATVNFSAESSESLLNKRIKSVQTRLPYLHDGFYYTDVLIMTVEGDLVHLQTKGSAMGPRLTKPITGISSYWSPVVNEQFPLTTYIQKNAVQKLKILPPYYEEIPDPMEKSKYEDEKGRVAIIPPAAIPLQEEGTGQQVIRVPAANGDGYQFQKPDGTIVPEENVTTGPDPVVTPSPGGQTTPGGQPIPEGTPTVTPTPTPQNPNPEPIPLTPDQTAPPGDGTETPVDPNPYPDGESCDVGLKFPKFVPFFNTLSNAFPFSIPWDIERAFIAAFSDIGDERPSFELDIGIGDNKQIVKITTPAFFDDWKPFTDSLIRFIFAIGIMFGIYRFMKGGSS